MRSILIGGKAGQGIAKTAELLGKALVKLGYHVFNYRDYPSLIRGGHNFNVVVFDKKPVYSHVERNYDILAALDDRTLDVHSHEISSTTLRITLKGHGGDIEIDPLLLRKHNIPFLSLNIIFLGAIACHLGIPFEVMKSVVSSLGEKNIQALKLGYNLTKEENRLKKSNKKLLFLTGNEAIGLGAIASGIDIYIAYPMTPATPVLHFLAARKNKYNYTVLQLENEIAVVNAALGASYAGANVMVGTSGGGFALMTEAISLQGMSEVPLVVYLAQRTGPSTGVPTYTAQSDLLFAIHAGHGEFPRVVLAPGDPAEAFRMTMTAFYLSNKFRVLSIILGDKHLGESHYTHTLDEFSPLVKPEKFITLETEDYKSYKITENGISPRSVPGAIPFAVRATSYEHDEEGITTEDPHMIEKMVEKRLRKWESLSVAVKNLEPVSVYGEGDKAIVSWGSTKGVIFDTLKRLEGWKFVKINILAPFPSEEVLKELDDAKRVVVIENSATGQLSKLLAMKTGLITDDKILRYDARPFTVDYIFRRLRG